MSRQALSWIFLLSWCINSRVTGCFIYEKPPSQVFSVSVSALIPLSQDPHAKACRHLLKLCKNGNLKAIQEKMREGALDVNCIDKVSDLLALRITRH
jgi:hypothetical protein